MAETELDIELKPEVVALADELGKSVVFNVRAKGAFNPVTNKVSKGALSSYTIKVFPPSSPRRELIDGELIKDGDIFIAFPSQGLSFNPVSVAENIESVLIDGEFWKLQRVSPVYSGESIIMYKAHLRS